MASSNSGCSLVSLFWDAAIPGGEMAAALNVVHGLSLTLRVADLGQTDSGVAGISICRTPKSASAPTR
jgi:hypothetical protein